MNECSNSITHKSTEKDIFNFKRTIEKKELSFFIILKEESIDIKIEEVLENLSTDSTAYEKSFSLDIEKFGYYF